MMNAAAADPRLRIIKYRGYLTACRVLGTLAFIAMLTRGRWASELWNTSVVIACWSVLLPTAVLEFWLRRQTRE